MCGSLKIPVTSIEFLLNFSSNSCEIKGIPVGWRQMFSNLLWPRWNSCRNPGEIEWIPVGWRQIIFTFGIPVRWRQIFSQQHFHNIFTTPPWRNHHPLTHNNKKIPWQLHNTKTLFCLMLILSTGWIYNGKITTACCLLPTYHQQNSCRICILSECFGDHWSENV